MATRITGTVKLFSVAKGFGFIQPNDGSHDVFVHLDTIHRAGLETLKGNDIVSFEIVKDGRTGKLSADNIKLEN